jgi:hypothetical protein
MLGSTPVKVSVSTYGSGKGAVLLKVHDNEQTAEEAARRILEEIGGQFIKIENESNRYVSFMLGGRERTFDPNRMYTPEGIRSSLQIFNSYSASAAREVLDFGRFVLRLLPDTGMMIAVHNNTDQAYSVLDYSPDAKLSKEAAGVHLNPAKDPDDFVFTTDSAVFSRYRQAGYNVVLQRNRTTTDDGSLSIYYGRASRWYTNIETQFGHFEEQAAMLRVLLHKP